MSANLDKPYGGIGKKGRIGHRMTAGREAILNILAKSEDHLSAEDIYINIHAQIPSIGLTTVYRTLELLVSIGMVAKSIFGDGRARFELLQGPRRAKYHHHLVCTGCSRVIEYVDFSDEEIAVFERIHDRLASNHDFIITSSLVQYCGLCPKCVEEKRSADLKPE